MLRAAFAGVGLVVASAVALWILTPSGSDLQTRVAADAARHGVALMRADEVPALLTQAIIATEDERFFEHHGIDVAGLGRAILFDVSHLCACQGGSTITQQLVKEVHLDGSDAGLNKLAGMALAFKVELRFSKQQILADYLSEVLTGYGLYGMPAAACAYSGRPLGALDLGQVALLAGMPQAPSALDPRLHPSAAAARRQQVLDAMVSEAYLTAGQAAAAAAEPVLTPPGQGGC